MLNGLSNSSTCNLKRRILIKTVNQYPFLVGYLGGFWNGFLLNDCVLLPRGVVSFIESWIGRFPTIGLELPKSPKILDRVSYIRKRL